MFNAQNVLEVRVKAENVLLNIHQNMWSTLNTTQEYSVHIRIYYTAPLYKILAVNYIDFSAPFLLAI